jgi:hypothetical protein
VKPRREKRMRGRGPLPADPLGRLDEAAREAVLLEEIAAEFSTEELLEFLEADQLPVDADPEFRERLRSELWTLVQSLVKR